MFSGSIVNLDGNGWLNASLELSYPNEQGCTTNFTAPPSYPVNTNYNGKTDYYVGKWVLVARGGTCTGSSVGNRFATFLLSTFSPHLKCICSYFYSCIC